MGGGQTGFQAPPRSVKSWTAAKRQTVSDLPARSQGSGASFGSRPAAAAARRPNRSKPEPGLRLFLRWAPRCRSRLDGAPLYGFAL